MGSIMSWCARHMASPWAWVVHHHRAGVSAVLPPQIKSVQDMLLEVLFGDTMPEGYREKTYRGPNPTEETGADSIS